jgi:hypothetical protein
VVLAGGLGMRLRPYTMNIPKPLLPLGDQATMEIVLNRSPARDSSVSSSPSDTGRSWSRRCSVTASASA